MNKTFSTIAIGSVIGLASITPTHAAVIDRVKAKVDAIKSETAVIKSKASDIQSQIRQQAGELDQVQNALDALQSMKDKFAGGGLDPADLLDMIDTDEIQNKLAELREQRENLQFMLNDPNLEGFRYELLGVLEGVRELITPVEQNDFVAAAAQVVEVSPFQRLVEVAPRPVLALLKEVMGDRIDDIADRVDRAIQTKTWLVDNGLLPIGRDRVCNATNRVGTSTVLLFLWDHQRKVEEVQASWNNLTKDMEKKEEAMEWVMPKIGIHGYFAIAPPKSFVAESMADINSRKGGFEWQLRATKNVKELVTWMREDSDICDIAFVD